MAKRWFKPEIVDQRNLKLQQLSATPRPNDASKAAKRCFKSQSRRSAVCRTQELRPKPCQVKAGRRKSENAIQDRTGLTKAPESLLGIGGLK
jgi:hypothetical protein